MNEIITNHEEPSSGLGLTKLDKLRLGGKFVRVALRNTVNHPSFMFISMGEMFGYISEENMKKREVNRERIGGRVFTDIAGYMLKHEMGNETHRLYLADRLAELRYEHGLPLSMPVQEMRKAI